jgi:hypothetical protein
VHMRKMTTAALQQKYLQSVLTFRIRLTCVCVCVLYIYIYIIYIIYNIYDEAATGQ